MEVAFHTFYRLFHFIQQYLLFIISVPDHQNLPAAQPEEATEFLPDSDNLELQSPVSEAILSSSHSEDTNEDPDSLPKSQGTLRLIPLQNAMSSSYVCPTKVEDNSKLFRERIMPSHQQQLVTQVISTKKTKNSQKRMTAEVTRGAILSKMPKMKNSTDESGPSTAHLLSNIVATDPHYNIQTLARNVLKTNKSTTAAALRPQSPSAPTSVTLSAAIQSAQNSHSVMVPNTVWQEWQEHKQQQKVPILLAGTSARTRPINVSSLRVAGTVSTTGAAGALQPPPTAQLETLTKIREPSALSATKGMNAVIPTSATVEVDKNTSTYSTAPIIPPRYSGNTNWLIVSFIISAYS